MSTAVRRPVQGRDGSIALRWRRVPRALGLLVGVFVSLSAMAHAASIRVAELAVRDNSFCLDGGGSVPLVLLIEGDLRQGDTKALRRGVERIERHGGAVYICGLFLDSIGGDLYEAMKLGRYIREKRLPTQVAQDARCFSACVFAFIGGVVRIPSGLMGIHSFYSPELLGSGSYEIADAAYNATSGHVSDYLREMRVPQLLLDRMITIQHFELEILESEDLKALGIAGHDPVYLQTLSR